MRQKTSSANHCDSLGFQMLLPIWSRQPCRYKNRLFDPLAARSPKRLMFIRHSSHFLAKQWLGVSVVDGWRVHRPWRGLFDERGERFNHGWGEIGLNKTLKTNHGSMIPALRMRPQSAEWDFDNQARDDRSQPGTSQLHVGQGRVET